MPKKRKNLAGDQGLVGAISADSGSATRSDISVLHRLGDWDGLSRLDGILGELKSRPNSFLLSPRVLRSEGFHSDLLKWLLDPNGWHGLEDRFATAFVQWVRQRCKVPTDRSITVAEVHREFSTGFGPVDLLIRGRHGEQPFMVAVENKIDSPLGPEQLNRYANGLARLFGPQNAALVYLTPDGREPTDLPDCRLFICASYRDVADRLDNAIAGTSPDPNNAIGLTLARHYLAALRTHIMAESNPDVDAICRSLYQEHQEAWRAIRRRLPSQRDEAHAQIGARVSARLEADYGGRWQFTVRRNRYASVFREGWRALGVYEEEPIIGLDQTSGAQSAGTKIHFRLVAAISETDAGEEYSYKLRLKIDQSENPKMGRDVIAAIRRLPEEIAPTIPNRSQFTVTLKSTNRLPGLGEGPDGVPDSVVDWFARHVADLVPVLDGVLPRT